MSCLLCDSIDHLTQNCDKYVTDTDRNRYLFSINTCKYCKSSYEKYNTWCVKCEPITKCFSCFSRQHHTFFCPIRERNPPKLFLPKIDKVLLKRFFNTFGPLEQYSMVITIPEALKVIQLKNVKILPNISRENFLQPFNDEIVVIDDNLKIEPLNNDDQTFFDSTKNGYQNFVDAVSKDLLIIKANAVTLKKAILPSETFLKLLSPITKILQCSNVIITTKFLYVILKIRIITFSQILQKMPILEELLLLDTNIKVENTWVEDLQIYGKKILKLRMEVEDLNFNVKMLAKLIKEKKMQICLCLNNSMNSNDISSILMREEFSNHFSPPSSYIPYIPTTDYFLLIYNPKPYYLTPF